MVFKVFGRPEQMASPRRAAWRPPSAKTKVQGLGFTENETANRRFISGSPTKNSQSARVKRGEIGPAEG